MARILVVEDEVRIASFLYRALAAEGFAVDRVEDGASGLDLARSGDYDLVLLDLMLPRIDGVSVLKGILDSRPTQPVFVLSALADVEARIRCLELGAADYLTKPFELAELIARVRARLRRSPTIPAESNHLLEVGGIRLDLARRVIKLGEKRANLSTREFLLVQYLLRHEGEVCTREELLSSVWGYSFNPETNVLDVYVGRLRAKLGHGIIETVRSVGYCLNAPS